jgi:hypothetical protein
MTNRIQSGHTPADFLFIGGEFPLIEVPVPTRRDFPFEVGRQADSDGARLLAQTTASVMAQQRARAVRDHKERKRERDNTGPIARY